MAAGGETQRRRPAQVAVAPEDQNSHRRGSLVESARWKADWRRATGAGRGSIALVAILLLGVGLRLGEAWDGRAPVYDAQAYAAIAANLDRGQGFTVGPGATQPSSNYSPGLPLFVAGLYKLTGGVHERFARVVLALIGIALDPLHLPDREAARDAGEFHPL